MPRKVTQAARGATVDPPAGQVEIMLAVHQRRRKEGKTQEPPKGSELRASARIPRVTRLMALAIKLQEMVDRGEVRDYADLGRLGYVTRARITQIMNLLLLAPAIQEEIIGWAETASPPLRMSERSLRPIARTPVWSLQKQLWCEMKQCPS